MLLAVHAKRRELFSVRRDERHEVRGRGLAHWTAIKGERDEAGEVEASEIA